VKSPKRRSERKKRSSSTFSARSREPLTVRVLSSISTVILSCGLGASPVRRDQPVEIGQCGATPREPNRPGRPTDQGKGHTLVRMSNLIAKIRHWLHLDKKPKTS